MHKKNANKTYSRVTLGSENGMEIETLYGNSFIVRNQKTSFYQKKMNVLLYLLMNDQ